MSYQSYFFPFVSPRFLPSNEFYFRKTLWGTIQEYGPSLELLVEDIDEENNEDDWISLNDNDHDNRQYQQTQQIDHIQIYRNTFISSSEDRTSRIFKLPQANINSIRSQLRNRNYLLLKVSNNCHYYICPINEMRLKVADYFHDNENFILVQNLHEIDNDYVQNLLKTMVDQMKKVLDDLFNRHCLTEPHLQQMQMDATRIRLDFLSFQPDTRYVRNIFCLHCLFLLF